MNSSRISLTLSCIAMISLAYAAEVRAEEYRFLPAPAIDQNRMYRVNRLTGEMGACQYVAKPETVGVALCHEAGEGAGPQPIPGDYDLVRSSHEREGGVFRVNSRTGEVSVCYVDMKLAKVVCTPQAR